MGSTHPITSNITFDIDLSLSDETSRIKKSKSSFSSIIKEQNERCNIHCMVSSRFLNEEYGFFHNGFFGAIFTAYSYHIPLTLSPDNFWYQILQEVSKHINLNADKFKHLITEATEKPLIDVDITGKCFVDGIDMIVKKLDSMVKDRTIIELCTTPFSTTTHLIQNCYGTILMNMMKEFFGYQMTTRCGIKQITLQGNEADWISLYNRVVKLSSMPYAEGIEDNLNLMIDTLPKIINCFKGDIDDMFWKNIISHDHGSGYDYVSGWITNFFIYDIRNNIVKNRNSGRKIDTDMIPAGYSITPFIWDNQGVKHDMIIYGGQCGIQLLPDASISPSFNMAFVELADA